MQVRSIETVDQFLSVVNSLHSKETNEKVKKQADNLLTDFYKTQQAWDITREILADPNMLDTTILLTTAKLLRIKIFYYFSDLSPEHYFPLFNFILGTN